MAKPAGGREKTKNRKQGRAGGAGLPRVGFCLESWVPEVFGPPASSRMVFERRHPRTLPVINPFWLQNRLSRVLFSSTGRPGPAGSGQRTLHPRVFVFCLGGPGPQSQRAGAHLPIHQPRTAPLKPVPGEPPQKGPRSGGGPKAAKVASSGRSAKRSWLRRRGKAAKAGGSPGGRAKLLKSRQLLMSTTPP